MTKPRALVAAVVVSVAGVGWIATHEGKRNRAYADPAHGWTVPTICYGHTKTTVRGMWLDDKQCLALLEKDAQEAAAAVLRLVKVPLSQGELDAYTSFVFNVGSGNFSRSTLLKYLNAGDRVAACNQLLRWDYAGAVRLAGLTARRKSERDLCLSQL